MTTIAAVHLWRGKFLVHPRSRTTDGVWIFAGPVSALELDCSDAQISDAVRSALAASRSGIAHPSDWNSLGQELLRAAGNPSRRTFQADKVTVDVEVEPDGSVFIVTFENRGPKHGSVEKGRVPLSSRAKTGDELGARIREALETDA
jgi:hypothetical protein